MTQWQTKYDNRQRQAVERAYCELRIRPAAKIPRLAAAGELTPEAGADPLEPFEIPASTVISIGKKADRRKAGRDLRPDLANMPARDRAHAMQLRLTSLIDLELSRLEQERAKHPNRPLDAEQARKVGRALRELATLPDPSEKRLPRTPGHRDADGSKPDSPTADSLAGQLLAASDQSVSPSTRDDANSTRAATETTPQASAADSSTRDDHRQPTQASTDNDAPS